MTGHQSSRAARRRGDWGGVFPGKKFHFQQNWQVFTRQSHDRGSGAGGTAPSSQLPLLFPYLLPPKFPAASQQAVARNSMAPGAGSLAGFLPFTQPSHTSCSLLLGSVPKEKKRWKQVVPVDLSSLRCCMTCSATLENCEMAPGACPCVWLSMDGRQSPFCSESCHFHIPRHPYHFLSCVPHPLPPARQAVMYLAVLWQILLFVRIVKKTHLSAC